MKALTLGLTLLIIGLIGATITYLSGMILHDMSFYKIGIAFNFIQLVGIICFFTHAEYDMMHKY